jgi:hypothetical protein
MKPPPILRCVTALVLPFLFTAGTSTTLSSLPPLASEDSAFGVFAAFAAKEFGYFKGRMGFDDDDYWTWAENHMRTLGAHWTRSNLQFVWDIVEPTIGGGYNWNTPMLTDGIGKRIYREGNAVHWLAVFHEGGGPVNPLLPARRKGVPPAQRPPLRNPLGYPEEYGAFVRAAVERYDGDGIDDAAPGVRVKYWQAGNEIMIWTASGRSPEDYARYFRLIRGAARKADRNAKLALIAPTQGFSIDPFIAEVIEILAPEREFDVLDIHHWGHAGNWKMTAIPQYRRLLDSLGLSDVQIWSCEHGTWNGAPAVPPPQSEQDQARSLVRRFVYNLNNGLDKLFWNNLMEWRDFSGDPASVFNSMGLVTDGQGPGEDPAQFNTERVAYWTYKLLASRIDNPFATSLGAMPEVTREGQTYGFAYQRKGSGNKFYILWAEPSADGAKVSFAVTAPSIIVTNLIPDRSGAFPKPLNIPAISGKITVSLFLNPVLVE